MNNAGIERKIRNGINNIGDDLITLADSERVKQHFVRHKRNINKWSRIAACFLLVICLSVPMLSLFMNDSLKGSEDGKPQNDFCVGDTVTNNAGSLTFVSETDSSVTFSLIKTAEQKIDFCIMGYVVVRSWIDENGKTQYETEGFFASTKSDIVIGNLTNRSDELILTVNGVVTDELPIGRGTYEIMIDFGVFTKNNSYLEQHFDFSPFGTFELTKQGVDKK